MQVAQSRWSFGHAKASERGQIKVGEKLADAEASRAHGPCRTHRRYQLTCETYERMVAACGNRCQTCGRSGNEVTHRRLVIDHDARIGWWAVRGLLCDGCNGQLRVDRPDPVWAKDYLTNPWYAEVLASAGLSTECPEEPTAPGTRVRDSDGRSWQRTKKGLWETGHKSMRPHTWRQLHHRYGPHNLSVRIPPPSQPRRRALPVTAKVRVDSAKAAARTLRKHMSPERRRELAALLLQED